MSKQALVIEVNKNPKIFRLAAELSTMELSEKSSIQAK